LAAGIGASSVVAVAERLWRYVEKELEDVRQVVARVATQPSPQPARPTPALTNQAAARQLMGTMRVLIQEERFRSGKLR
jgi:hypothetical protein